MSFQKGPVGRKADWGKNREKLAIRAREGREERSGGLSDPKVVDRAPDEARRLWLSQVYSLCS